MIQPDGSVFNKVKPFCLLFYASFADVMTHDLSGMILIEKKLMKNEDTRVHSVISTKNIFLNWWKKKQKQLKICLYAEEYKLKKEKPTQKMFDG